MVKGVIVGCDHQQEWLLSYWWEHYTKHNIHPVAFFDFGMSEEAQSFCSSKGLLISIPESEWADDSLEEVPSQTLDNWAFSFGRERLERSRSAWLKKPLAAKFCPFEEAIWVDLDCLVFDDLTPCFDLVAEHDIAIMPETDAGSFLDHVHGISFFDEIIYNSGVFVFKKGAQVIEKWAAYAREFAQQFSGDQHILSRVIYNEGIPVKVLPEQYNFMSISPRDPPAVIIHFAGHNGKAILRELKAQNESGKKSESEIPRQ